VLLAIRASLILAFLVNLVLLRLNSDTAITTPQH
jgi:hypothetical protein